MTRRCDRGVKPDLIPELVEEGRRLAGERRVAQGLDPSVTDDVILRRVLDVLDVATARKGGARAGP